MTSLLITLSILFQAAPQDPLTGTERQLREIEDLLQTQGSIFKSLSPGTGGSPSPGAGAGPDPLRLQRTIEELLQNPQSMIPTWAYVVVSLSFVFLILSVIAPIVIARKSNRRLDRALEMGEDHTEQLKEILGVLAEIRDELKGRPSSQSE